MAGPAWMLDTNILSDLIRNPRGALNRRLETTEPGAVCTSIVVPANCASVPAERARRC